MSEAARILVVDDDAKIRTVVRRGLAYEGYRVVEAPATRERFAALGFEPRGTTPEELERHIRSEIARWSSVIKAQAIKPE